MSLVILLMCLCLCLTLLGKLLHWNKHSNKETSSNFECGFDSFSMARNPFSLRFFKLTIIFMIFDVEIAMILPTPILQNLNLSDLGLEIFILVFILLGLMLEQKTGCLDWIK